MTTSVKVYVAYSNAYLYVTVCMCGWHTSDTFFQSTYGIKAKYLFNKPQNTVANGRGSNKTTTTTHKYYRVSRDNNNNDKGQNDSNENSGKIRKYYSTDRPMILFCFGNKEGSETKVISCKTSCGNMLLTPQKTSTWQGIQQWRQQPPIFGSDTAANDKAYIDIYLMITDKKKCLQKIVFFFYTCFNLFVEAKYIKVKCIFPSLYLLSNNKKKNTTKSTKMLVPSSYRPQHQRERKKVADFFCFSIIYFPFSCGWANDVWNGFTFSYQDSVVQKKSIAEK